MLNQTKSPAPSHASLNALLTRRQGHIHLVGITGIGMAGLAYHLKQQGWEVSGCDKNADNRLAQWLRVAGIKVIAGHAPEHLSGVDWAIYSTAISLAEPELQAAHTAHLPTFRRGAVLAAWLRNWTSVIVCGTHGKTTTATMLVQILRRLNRAPAYLIGGECAALPGVADIGSSNVLVAEADESDGTLAEYAPTLAILTNLEYDHAEHYADIKQLQACFQKMLSRVTQGVCYGADDREAAQLVKTLPRALGFGLCQNANLRAWDIADSADSVSFRMALEDAAPVSVALPVGGKHNVLNALAACAAALELGVTLEEAAGALAGFVPARRRFELLSVTKKPLVFSDYAHHPTEIAATMRTFLKTAAARRVVVYQPHRYSRTKALIKDFATAFAGADELLLAPVYPASEPPLTGGQIWDLYAECRRRQIVPQIATGSLDRIWEYLIRNIQTDTALLVMGAGDIEQLAERIRQALQERSWTELNPAPVWLTELQALKLSPSTTLTAPAPMAAHATLGVGGKADILVEIDALHDLSLILNWARTAGAPVQMLGAGSNILISDLGARGLVLRLAGKPFHHIKRLAANQILVGAGTHLAQLLVWCRRQGLTGLEFLHHVPGTVGGALRMNAGAWGWDIAKRVLRTQCMQPDGSLEWLTSENLQFSYRDCPGLSGRIAIAAVLQLTPDEPANIQKRLDEITKRRQHVNWKNSAGSAFRNPPGDYAGRLLEAAGCKKLAVGGAHVAQTHANVITTTAGATASDVSALQAIMRDHVRASFKVELVNEIVYCE